MTYLRFFYLLADRVRCVEWCRKLSSLSDDELEACKIKNDYAQLLRIQVRNKFLHGPFLSPPPETGRLCPLTECLGNLMAKQVNNDLISYLTLLFLLIFYVNTFQVFFIIIFR